MTDETNQPPDASATPPTDPVAEASDVRVSMHTAECPDCGIPFALPTALYLRRLEDRGHVYCPAGHLIELRPDDPRRQVEAIGRAMLLQGRLAAARRECQSLREELARRPVPQTRPLTKEEINRRARLLAADMERLEFGRKLCRFCGKKISGNDYNTAQHMKRRHMEEIEATTG